LQFRAQLECDSPERANAARERPGPVKPNQDTGFTKRASEARANSLRPYLRRLSTSTKTNRQCGHGEPIPHSAGLDYALNAPPYSHGVTMARIRAPQKPISKSLPNDRVGFSRASRREQESSLSDSILTHIFTMHSTPRACTRRTCPSSRKRW
jgi:hypothetical protein